MISSRNVQEAPLKSTLRVVGRIASSLPGKDRLTALLAILMVFVSTLFSVGAPIAASRVIDMAALPLASGATMLWLAVGAFTAARFLGQLLTDLRWVIVNPLLYRIMYRYCLDQCAAIASHSARMGERYNRIADVAEKVATIEKAQQGLMALSHQIFVVLVPTIMEIGLILGVVSWKLTWRAPIVILGCLIVFLITVLTMRKQETSALRQCLDSDNKISREAGQVIGYAQLIKQFDCFDLFLSRINNRIEDSLREHTRFFRVKALRSTLRNTATALCYLAVFGLIYYLFLGRREATAGAVFLVLTYLDRVLAPVVNLSMLAVNTRNAMISIQNAEIVFAAGQVGAASRDGCRIQCLFSNDLKFMIYDGDTILCTVGGGDRIFVTGPSGSGKTTFLHEILEHELLARQGYHAVYLTDTPLLVEGSVLENISLSHLPAARERAKEVWHQLAAYIGDRDLVALDQIADTLSDGEKQILAAVRAILHDPMLLIIDEACNAMDKPLEALIMNFISEYLKNATIFVVTHRGVPPIAVDWILTLHDKKIVSATSSGNVIMEASA